MTRLDAAHTRLEQAIARLERVAQQSGRLAGPDPSGLVSALEAAQQENADLVERNAEASGRLDRVIERLRAVLGG